jgi:type VI protein secretion system component Hcp
MRVERTRRGRDETSLRRPRPAEGSSRQPISETNAILELQAAAGNRSVAAALNEATVQRKATDAGMNDGGVLALDSGEAIPLQSATWSVKRRVAVDSTGHQRSPRIEPFESQVGDLVLTRARDAQSPRLKELFASEHEHGSLRLDQPSAEGALPAMTLELHDVGFAAISQSSGDRPIETLTFYVGKLHVAGMGKEAPKARAVAHLQLDGGPPIPVLWWQRNGGKHADAPISMTVKIGAGKTATRLAAALDRPERLNIALSPDGGGSAMDLRDSLVAKVSSSADGPNVVEVTIIGESPRERPSP